jgi:cysteine-rich repeat protein
MTCHKATCNTSGACEYMVTIDASCGNKLQCNASGNCVAPPAVCGNNVLESGEQCDDGNTVESDDCVNCREAFCGDGYLGPNEECDPLAPGWSGKCNEICKRTFYDTCQPATKCPPFSLMDKPAFAERMERACTFAVPTQLRVRSYRASRRNA